MTTPTELKTSLVAQYNDLIVQLQRIEGAIAACDQLSPEPEVEAEEPEEE